MQLPPVTCTFVKPDLVASVDRDVQKRQGASPTAPLEGYSASSPAEVLDWSRVLVSLAGPMFLCRVRMKAPLRVFLPLEAPIYLEP